MAELALPVLNTLILGSALVAGVVDYIRTKDEK
jgi:hypothetical protein